MLALRRGGDGRRVQRVAGGVATRFVYDGDQVCLETSGANAPLTYRLAGVGTVRASDGRQLYEQENALGSALTVRDNAGAVVGRTEYDAYGREVYQSGTDRGDHRFAGAKGYQNDDATGMQLLGARYYLPVLGRFLTQDPVGHEGGLNLYAYCGNSPLSRTDAGGTDWDWAQYRHDVGQVFLGYGDVLNPVNWAKGAVSLTQMAVEQGPLTAGKAVVIGTWDTLTNWSSPRDFGRSWMSWSLIAAGGAEAAGVPRPNLLSYASRIAVREAEGGAMHRFPLAIDSMVTRFGRITNGRNGYIQFNAPGSMFNATSQKFYSGTWEIGGFRKFGVVCPPDLKTRKLEFSA